MRAWTCNMTMSRTTDSNIRLQWLSIPISTSLRDAIWLYWRKGTEFPASLKIQNSSSHNYLSVCHSHMRLQLFNQLIFCEQNSLEKSSANNKGKILSIKSLFILSSWYFHINVHFLEFCNLDDGKFCWFFGKWGEKPPKSEIIVLYKQLS